jgi:hypothetical protein
MANYDTSGNNVAGSGDPVETIAAQVFETADKGETVITHVQPAIIKSTSVDDGNTPSTTLRPGTLMARKTSDGKLYPYDADATDGTQLPVGVLPIALSMKNGPSLADKYTRILGGGIAAVATWLGLDYQARGVMQRNGWRFTLPVPDGANFLICPRKVQQIAGNTTLTSADNGDLFMLSAAANMTLPAKENGLMFEFVQSFDGNMAILSPGSADDIIAKNDAGADSVTFSTAGEKIGSHCMVRCMYAGAVLRWVVYNLGGTTMTIA